MEKNQCDDLGNALPFEISFWWHTNRWVHADGGVVQRKFRRYRLRRRMPNGTLNGPTYNSYERAAAALPDWLAKVER